MKTRIVLIAFLAQSVLLGTTIAQSPTVNVTVRKTPGGKGRLVSYDAMNATMTVALKLASGKTTQITASRHHVSPSAWAAIRNLFRVRGKLPGDRQRTTTEESSADAAIQAPTPIQLKTTFGDSGTMVSFDADANKVRIDFGGRQGRPIAINQLDADSWRAAKLELAQRLQDRSR